MFVRIPHFRPVLAVAAFWLVTCWYLYGRTGVTNSVQPPTPGIGTNNAGKHISKLPERYPVTSLRPLPTGPATVRIPTIQRQPPPAEDAAGRKTRLARLRAVQASFQHSWDGYKAHAWLSDEVTPLTGRRKDPFGGWAATLVDALDTLWIMGLKDDFREAVKACEQIDFTTTRSNTINVFETTIRYLGGFLAAYELSEKLYPSLLRKAVEVAELLMGAFDTPNRMPIARWGWKECVVVCMQAAAGRRCALLRRGQGADSRFLDTRRAKLKWQLKPFSFRNSVP